MAADYELVQLRSGGFSLRSARYAETLHPGVVPGVEGQSLYAQQLRVRERVRHETGPCVVWDVGLGAGANAIAILRSVPGPVRLISFDNTLEPLEFALTVSHELEYIHGYEESMRELLRDRRVTIGHAEWEISLGDFPGIIRESEPRLPSPRAILYDPFSPPRNPEMWTQPHFANLLRLLSEPCSLATYSRSTMIRVALLLAGFYVGLGSATGQKEETTIAANRVDLIAQPLDQRWLARAQRSDSAEPMIEPVFRKAPLTRETFERLKLHPQFR